MSDYESWIWTELLAFDNTLSDLGVARYLRVTGFCPTGISLLLSSSDFVLLHSGMQTEQELFPDICSRFGHSRNENRLRQKWTNYQLAELVSLLQKRHVKVFFSIFSSYLHDRFHKEWVSSHPEMLICLEDGPSSGVNVIGRLKDGTLFEQIFAAKLQQVMKDYKFDGYHAADGMSYGNQINVSDPSDMFFNFFVERSAVEVPEALRGDSGNSPEVLTKRMQYVYHSKEIRVRWADFCAQRWYEVLLEITTRVHGLGREVMINSPGLSGMADGICVHGVDLRRFAAAGIDYIVTETVAANLHLIHGGHDRNFELAAQLAEIKVCMPGVKQLFLHGVKDVVESYDLLRHGTASLMREVYMMSNQFVIRGGKMQRAADGLMVCLGDGIKHYEWQFLKREWDSARSFEPVRAGEFTWLITPDIMSALSKQIADNGRLAPYFFIGKLMATYGFQVMVAAHFDELAAISGVCMVPYFDLLSAGQQKNLLHAHKHPLILLGEFSTEIVLPKGASGVLMKKDGGMQVGCLLLNFPGKAKFSRIPCPKSEEKSFMPGVLLDEICAVVREALDSLDRGGSKLSPADKSSRLLEMEDARGRLRCALLSTELHYTRPACIPAAQYDIIEKTSSFPYGEMAVRNGLLACMDCPLRLPPHGLAVVDFKKRKKTLESGNREANKGAGSNA